MNLPEPSLRAAAATACSPFRRDNDDIQTAVVNLVDLLARQTQLAAQPTRARQIAAVLTAAPNSMAHNMFLRQSIIRHGTATGDEVAAGLAAWVTVLFDLANLQQERAKALALARITPASLDRLAQALARSGQGCILAVPHTGSLELCAAFLHERGFNTGFVYSIGRQPTPTERWIYQGRSATRATAIPFGRRITGSAIAGLLQNQGVVIMVVDVYPSDRYKGVAVQAHAARFAFPSGPARFARAGTLVLPGWAGARGADGFDFEIGAPLAFPAARLPCEAAAAFSQSLAGLLEGFTEAHPEAYWLWHPIPNDPYLAYARQARPALLRGPFAAGQDDEATARAIDAMRLCGAA